MARRRRRPRGPETAAESADLSKSRRIPKSVSIATYARGANGERLCRYCRQAVTPPRRTFCGESCIHEWKLRSDWKYMREQVFLRDRGICAVCKTDCVALRGLCRAELLKLGYQEADLRRKTLWDVDHILEVVNGGGSCGINNLQTLCLLDHRKKTRLLREKKT